MSSDDGSTQQSVVKGAWSAEEDALLLKAIEANGTRKWSVLASHLPGRTGKQCRERWHNQLNPDISKSPWTEDEDRAPPASPPPAPARAPPHATPRRHHHPRVRQVRRAVGGHRGGAQRAHGQRGEEPVELLHAAQGRAARGRGRRRGRRGARGPRGRRRVHAAAPRRGPRRPRGRARPQGRAARAEAVAEPGRGAEEARRGDQAPGAAELRVGLDGRDGRGE